MSKVLIVDDQPGIRELLRMVLVHSGHDVFMAVTGREAIDIMAQRQPPLAVLDLHLPDMTGLDLVEQIHARHPGAVILLFTGVERESILAEAQQLGARDVFQKGDSLKHLGQVIDQLAS